MGVKGVRVTSKGLFPSLRQYRHPGGVEFYHYPSVLARRVWFYVRSLGKAHPPASFRYAHRDRDGFLIHFVTRGELWHRVRERVHTARKRDACLLDMGSDVTFGNSNKGKLEFYWAWFNGKEMPLLYQELRTTENPVFPSLDTARMESIFRELIALTAKPPPAYEVRASALLTQLLAELFASRHRGGDMPTLGQPHPLSDPVRRATDFITRNYELPLSIKQIASKSGQSMFYFTRLFHREMGMPPIAYLNQYRIEQAKQLLQASAKSVEEIARSVGYPQQNYFTRVFRKIVGVSPRQFREEQRRER